MHADVCHVRPWSKDIDNPCYELHFAQNESTESVFLSSLTAHYSMSKGVLFPNRTEFSLTSLACDDVGLDVLRCCHYIDMDGQRHTS